MQGLCSTTSRSTEHGPRFGQFEIHTDGDLVRIQALLSVGRSQIHLSQSSHNRVSLVAIVGDTPTDPFRDLTGYASTGEISSTNPAVSRGVK